MRIVGIDPSLTSTGLALVVDGRIVATANVKSTPTGDSPREVFSRIDGVADSVMEWVLKQEADAVVIESASYASKFGKPHERAGLYWFLIGRLVRARVFVAAVAPQSRAKYATGKGNSPKREVYATVKARYQPLTEARIGNNDVADAVLLAAMGARVVGEPVEAESLSEAHHAALTHLSEQLCK